jgi:BASS family bile acid:Na+ symporter
MKLLYKFSLILSPIFLLLTAFTYYIDRIPLAGIFLFVFFLSLAIGVKGTVQFKGFSFALLILAVVSLSMTFPDYFISWGSFELQILMVPLLQLIMFGMGTSMSLQDFSAVIKSPKAVIIGLICQFTIMPFIGFGLTILFNFPPEIAAGLL